MTVTKLQAAKWRFAMRSPVLCAFLVFIGLTALAPREAGAIPAWSRKEGVGCAYCHHRFNRLNQTGLDYYRRGFRTEAQPSDAKPELKADFSNYFSVLGRIDATKRDKRDYTTLTQATLYGGGEVSAHWSFLAETTVNPPDRQEVADLYLGYTLASKANKNRYLFVRGGQLLPALITLDNPWEVAADRDPAFARERRIGAAVGYNFDKFWAEVSAVTPAGATTRNKVDVVANGQYVFNDKGSSFGGFYWDGNVNTSATASDKFQRYGFVANMNELAKGKCLLAAGFTAGKGDTAAGGTAKVRAFFGQGEYVFSDKFSMLLHVVRADPDTSVSGNENTIYTASAFYWPADHVNLIGRLLAVNDGNTTDKRWTVSARFMY